MPRLSHAGLFTAGLYAVIVVGVFTFTWINTKPENVGYDWIPFILLSYPWFNIFAGNPLPGFVLNAVILYMAGALLGHLIGQIRAKN